MDRDIGKEGWSKSKKLKTDKKNDNITQSH